MPQPIATTSINKTTALKGPPPMVPTTSQPHPPILGPPRRLPKTVSESDTSLADGEDVESGFATVKLRNLNLKGSTSPPEMVKSMFNYKACREDELTLHRGSLIEVISKDSKESGDEGWWVGKTDGHLGVFPSNFVNSDVQAALSNLPSIALPTMIPLSELTIGEYVGAGGFCNVFRGVYMRKEVAVKVPHVEPKKKSTVDAIRQEGRLFHMLDHENIVKLHGVCLEKPALVMEFCAGGPLTEVYGRAQETSANIVVDWAIQIARGMFYLHEQAPICLVHRDLKGCNVLVKQRVCQCSTLSRTPLTPPDGLFRHFPTIGRGAVCSRCHGSHLDQLTLKITDFGLARETNERMSFAGTYPWMAPEVIKNQTCSKASDVWSYGVLLWELLTRQTPYKGVDQLAVAYKVAMNTMHLPIPKECPEHLDQIIKSCWAPEPHHRPNFSVLLDQLIEFREELIQTGRLQEPPDFSKMQDEMTVEIEMFFSDLKAKAVELSEKENELNVKDQRLKEQSRLLEQKEMEMFERELHLALAKHETGPKPLKRRGRSRIAKLFGHRGELISTPTNFVHNIAVRSTPARGISCSPPGSPASSSKNLRIYKLNDEHSMTEAIDGSPPQQQQSSIFGTLPRTRNNQLIVANGEIMFNERSPTPNEETAPKYRSTPNLNAIRTGTTTVTELVNWLSEQQAADAARMGTTTVTERVNWLGEQQAADAGKQKKIEGYRNGNGLERKNAYRRKGTKESSEDYSPEECPVEFDAVESASDLDHENNLDALATPRREPRRKESNTTDSIRFSASRKSMSFGKSLISKLLLNAGSIVAAPTGCDLLSASSSDAEPSPGPIFSQPPPQQLTNFVPTRGPGGLAFLHNDTTIRGSGRSTRTSRSSTMLTPDEDPSLRRQKISPTSPTDHATFLSNNKRLPQPTANTKTYCKTTPMADRRISQHPNRQISHQAVETGSGPASVHSRTHSCDEMVRNGTHLPPSSHHHQHQVPTIPSSGRPITTYNRPITQPHLSTVIPAGGAAVAPANQPQPFSVWNQGYEQCRLPSTTVSSSAVHRPERPLTLDLHQPSTPLTPAESGISTAGSSYVSLPSSERLPVMVDSGPSVYERLQRTPPLIPPRSRRAVIDDPSPRQNYGHL